MAADDVKLVGGDRAAERAAVAAAIAGFDFSRLRAYMVNVVGLDAVTRDLAEYKRCVAVAPGAATAPCGGRLRSMALLRCTQRCALHIHLVVSCWRACVCAGDCIHCLQRMLPFRVKRVWAAALGAVVGIAAP